MVEGLGTTLRRMIQEAALHASTLELTKHDVAYGCLDEDHSIYLVERGQLKAVTSTREGKECLLGIYTAGDVFGELCLLGRERLETVTAMTHTIVKRISSARIIAALANANLREEFVRYLTHRLFEQQQFITNLITADSEYRLATILVHLGRKIGTRDGHLLRIEERITQEELSAMVGTTRSRVGFFLKRFCQAGLVARTPDCFLVLNEPRLHNFLIGTPLTQAPAPLAHRQPVLR